MNLFRYNSQTKEFTQKENAFKDELESEKQGKDIFLIPPFSTEIEPPTLSENETCIFNGNSWDIVSDFRGQKQVEITTKNISIINYIGEIIDGFQLVSDNEAIDILQNPDKYNIVNMKLQDISNTQAYKDKIEAKILKEQQLKNITKRQLLIWIYTNYKKTEDDIFNAINTITDNDKRYLAKVNYNGTNNFYYGNEYVQLIGVALGLTSDDLKKMFNEANNL